MSERAKSQPETANNQTTRGPRFLSGKVLARSILGDPQEFLEFSNSALSREQTRVRDGSGAVSPLGFESSTSISFPSPQADTFVMNEPDFDQEVEIRQALVTLAETRKKERDERVKKLKALHLFQRFDEVRDSRILKRHEKRRAEWNSFKRRMAKRLNKDVDDLVINRAEEFRMLMEQRDLLAKARPIEERQGVNIWQMSLRDAWTRYISLGGPFSGLEMPFVDRPELQPDTMYYIRESFKAAAVESGTIAASSEIASSLTHAEKKVEQAIHDARAQARRQRERILNGPHIQDTRQKYHKAIEILQPGPSNLDGLHVTGWGIEAEYKVKLEQTMKLKQQEEEERAKAEEKKQRQANFRSRKSVASSPLQHGNAMQGDAASVGTTKTVMPIETMSWEPEVQGPSMNFETDRLLVQTQKGDIGHGVLECLNNGCCVVYYKWTRNLESNSIVSSSNNKQRFFLQDLEGSILPGQSKDFHFAFKSDDPGFFSEVWRFEGKPAMEETRHLLTIKGVALEEDANVVKRKNIEDKLHKDIVSNAVAEVLDELVEHVHTPRAKKRMLLEDPDKDRQVFIAQNKEAQIYYSNTTLKLFRALADSTFELLCFPEELRSWDYSLASLKRLISSIEDDSERERHMIQFNEITKVAGVPPTSTSMFNSICYEILVELADDIQETACAIRKKLGLPLKILEKKETVVREHVISTDMKEVATYAGSELRMRIGGPPVAWFDQELPRPVPGGELVPGGFVRVVKKVSQEIWEVAQVDQDTEGVKDGSGDLGESKPGLSQQDVARLEFEYLLRLNDTVYDGMANLSERLAILCCEADLRSQVIAQVVEDMNKSAADEMEMLIKEEKMDEARKIDPAKYQNIVDIDELFFEVLKKVQSEEAEQSLRLSESEVPGATVTLSRP